MFYCRLFSHTVPYLPGICWGAHPYLGSGAGTTGKSRRNYSLADMSTLSRFVWNSVVSAVPGYKDSRQPLFLKNMGKALCSDTAISDEAFSSCMPQQQGGGLIPVPVAKP